ncbi:MAG: NUDIX hydrolase [Cyanobacteria bacterium P01_H01_bin.121]
MSQTRPQKITGYTPEHKSELQPWQVLDSEQVFSHRYYSLRRDTVRLGNGLVLDDYFVSQRSDVALVMPVTRDRQVILVRQYRHAVQKILLEFPAGRFDAAVEDAGAAAQRELLEETGYGLDPDALDPDATESRLIALATLYGNPVRDTSSLFSFLAYPVVQLGVPQLDASEELETLKIPLTELHERICQGDVCVSGSVATYFLGRQYLQVNGLLE